MIGKFSVCLLMVTAIHQTTPLHEDMQSGLSVSATWRSPRRPEYSVEYRFSVGDLQLVDSTGELRVVRVEPRGVTTGGSIDITVASDTFRVASSRMAIRFDRLVQSIPSPAELNDARGDTGTTVTYARGFMHAVIDVVSAKTGAVPVPGVDHVAISTRHRLPVPDTLVHNQIVVPLNGLEGETVYLRSRIVYGYCNYGFSWIPPVVVERYGDGIPQPAGNPDGGAEMIH